MEAPVCDGTVAAVLAVKVVGTGIACAYPYAGLAVAPVICGRLGSALGSRPASATTPAPDGALGIICTMTGCAAALPARCAAGLPGPVEDEAVDGAVAAT